MTREQHLAAVTAQEEVHAAKMEWTKLEMALRDTLASAKAGELQASEALYIVSDYIGAYTKRGYALNAG